MIQLTVLNAGRLLGAGFGPLVADPQHRLDLPAGFSYQIVSRAGDTMSDGFRVPGNPDGMGAFAGPPGSAIVVCNHENHISPAHVGFFGANNELLPLLAPARLYDAGAGGAPPRGGTRTFVYDEVNRALVSQQLSLAGTVRNCSGGATPWGSWLTCEETLITPDGDYAKRHGYVFEVAASAIPPASAPPPLTAMGKFNHEAASVDPHTGIVYLTEDRDDSLLYRFIPLARGNLAAGGALQALAVGASSLDTRNWGSQPDVLVGQILSPRWITLTNVNTDADDLRARGAQAGAAIFARGEGITRGRGEIYFASTSGGEAQKGQIWRYRPSAAEGTAGEAGAPGELELYLEPNNSSVFESGDNITLAPWGDLVICEDGAGEDRLLGITPDREIYRLGRNALSSSELTGATFSPSGRTLFVNFLGDGLTFAIQGPWAAAGVDPAEWRALP